MLGGVVFWLPNLLYHYLAKTEPTGAALLVLTVIMPFAVCVAYFISRAKGRHSLHASSMLLGIWILGPTMIILGQTFEGAGFRNVQTLLYWAVATAFPPLTLVMAGFDLSVGALLLGTVLLLLARCIYERTEPVQLLG